MGKSKVNKDMLKDLYKLKKELSGLKQVKVIVTKD
jgi:hypothetical protein